MRVKILSIILVFVILTPRKAFSNGDFVDYGIAFTLLGIGWVIASPYTVPRLLVKGGLYKNYGYPPYPFIGESALLVENGRSKMFNLGLVTQQMPNDDFAIRTDLNFTYSKIDNVEFGITKFDTKLENQSETSNIFDVLKTWSFARSPQWIFRAGLGYERIDGKNLHHGFKSTYRIRWAKKPIQVNINYNMTIGQGFSPMYELYPHLGFHINRYELMCGYRRRTTSGEKIQGPEFGVRFWF